MKIATLVYATGALILLGATLPANAQYINPYTNYSWNNSGSAFLDTTLIGMRHQLIMGSSLGAANISSAAIQAAYNKQLKLGQSRIKSGKATTRFTGRAFPTELWIKQCGGTTPVARKQIGDEIAIQRNIWSQEARARSADTSDMAQALGLAFVLAWEGQTGNKATTAQYKGITQDFRTMLLTDALYQGMSNTGKQAYLEGKLLGATDPVRLLREGERTGDAATVQKAHEGGSRYIKFWVPRGYTHYVATATGFRETK
jgi:hypothetical protein